VGDAPAQPAPPSGSRRGGQCVASSFDRIDHTALRERVRDRIKDKRVLRLVKAFLKAGILTEQARLSAT
jgi:RNA-directed DNA polymerase